MSQGKGISISSLLGEDNGVIVVDDGPQGNATTVASAEPAKTARPRRTKVAIASILSSSSAEEKKSVPQASQRSAKALKKSVKKKEVPKPQGGDDGTNGGGNDAHDDDNNNNNNTDNGNEEDDDDDDDDDDSVEILEQSPMADKGDEVEAPKEKPKAAPRKKSTKSSQQTIKLIRTVNDVPANPKKKTMQPSIINLMNLDDDVSTAKTAVKSMSSTADTTTAVDTTKAVESEAANTSAAETLPQSNAEVPATATTATPSSTKDKPKVQRKRKPADPNTKKKVAKKTTTSTSVTPSVDKPEPEKPVLSFNELQNQSLKKPNPSSSLPPPQMVDTTTKPTSKEEPIVAIHVPLFSKDESLGSTQVVFNVMKMCEDKYGWKAIHPNASKFDMDLYNDDELDEDDDNDAMDDDQEQHEEVPKVPVKIDKRRLQKGKPKIGQYDYEDPFIDDSETLWEEQRASTKDGFFVYWGPLVEEGKNAVIERADGTVKRTRKRVAGTTNNAGSSRKRQATNKQPVQIAPTPAQSTSTTKASASKASSTTPAPVEHTTQDGEPATTSS